MKQLGGALRWLLNINSIWGLMIVSSFLLTVYQHYRPVTTKIEAGLWRPGANEISISVAGKEGRVYESKFQLVMTGSEISIDEAYKEKKDSAPYLIGAQQAGEKIKLLWKNNKYGRYTLTINGHTMPKRPVVTLEGLTDAAMGMAKAAFDLGLGLVAAFVLFLGLMKVGEDAGIVQIAARVVRPVIRFLFPDVPADHPANGAILMNVTTSMLGLGNAATPFGLKAMEELQKLNPHKNIASDSQIMMMAWNTAGWSFLPLTILAVRQSAGTDRPLDIILTSLVAGFVATTTAVIMVKALGTLPMFRYEAAVAEDAATADSAKTQEKQ